MKTIIAAFAIALVAVACGGTKSAEKTDAPATTETKPADAPPATPPADAAAPATPAPAADAPK